MDSTYHASAYEVIFLWSVCVFARLCCWLMYHFFSLKLQSLLLSARVASRFSIGHQDEIHLSATMLLRSLHHARPQNQSYYKQSTSVDS
jgi:hypothetical protein